MRQQCLKKVIDIGLEMSGPALCLTGHLLFYFYIACTGFTENLMI